MSTPTLLNVAFLVSQFSDKNHQEVFRKSEKEIYYIPKQKQHFMNSRKNYKHLYVKKMDTRCERIHQPLNFNTNNKVKYVSYVKQ